MTKKPIMIDDVDVYECEHLREEFTEFYLNDPDIDYINYCCAYTNECKKYSDCYYKQLKRKEEECERLKKLYEEVCSENLKEIYEMIKKNDLWRGIVNVVNEKLEEQLDQLKAENDELKEDYATAKSMYDLCQSDFMKLEKIKDKYKQALQDIKKITVTLKADICSYCDSKDTDRCEQTDIDELEQILQKCEVIDA